MKKITLFLSIIAVSIFSTSAQNKKLEKIKHYFNHKKYEKCISKSTECYVNNPQLAAPYYYSAMSYYKLYNDQSDIKSIKEIAKKLNKGRKKEGKDEYEETFKTEITDFHNILKKYAYSYYQANKIKSKFYYDYLAKIYNDTLAQYDEIVLEIKPGPDAEIVKLTKEGKINQTDDAGLKQGKWMKVYSNGETAYIVYFKDNKPIGELKRFHENGKLSSLLVYDEDGKNATATFYDDKGFKISEGNYVGKLKNGKWFYYFNDKKIKDEEYIDGKLNGFQITFFENGQIYDKKKYENDLQVGVWEKFYKSGKPHLKSFLKNGKMNGAVVRYYKTGLPEVKGQYKNDLKEGKWIFYSEDGKSVDTIIYKNGKDVNEVDKENIESEKYKQNIEKSENLLDPANYKNNPYEYINKQK